MRLCLNTLYRFTAQTNPLSSNHFLYARDIPANLPREHMNLFQAINSAIDISLASDSTYLLFYI